MEKAVYPEQAQTAGIQGQVLMELHVSETGDVESVDVISGDPVLVPSATAAVKKWKFKPFIRNGKAIKVSARLPIDFAFDDKIIDVSKERAFGSGNAQSSTPVKLPAGMSSGMVVHKVAPVYPADARANHVQGTVWLQAEIGKDGLIKGLKVVSGPRELTDAAVGAVQQWRYRPYLLNGEPVAVETQIQVNFQLR